MISITTIRTKNWSARLIHIGMWLWFKLRGLPTQTCYNHVEVRFGNMTSGAIDSGVKTRKWEDYVKSKSGKYFQYKNYQLNLTSEQLKNGINYLQNSENISYEFENFFWHLIKIITGKWLGDKTSKKTYCYEHAIRFMNSTGKYDLNVFMNPYEFEVYAEKNLKQFEGQLVE